MPEETKRLLGEVHEDADDVIGAVNGLVASQKRTRKVIAGLIVVVLAASLFIVAFVRQSTCNTNRGHALTGPSSDRVSDLLSAFLVAAGGANLTDQQRTADLAELDKARARFPKIPTRAKLTKQGDGQIVIWVDIVHALDANHDYMTAVASHPVCSLWSL